MPSAIGNPFWLACLVTVIAWLTGIEFWSPIALYLTDWKPGPLDALHRVDTTIVAIALNSLAAPVCGALCAGGWGMRRRRLSWSFVTGALLGGLALATVAQDPGWQSLLGCAVYGGILAATVAGLGCGIEHRRRAFDADAKGD